MAVDMFMQIENIPGEAQDKDHTNQIDVLAWSWGLSNSGSMATGGGGGSGQSSANDFSFTKWVDKASPELMKACAFGTHIPKGQLTVRKAGGTKPLDYLVIKFEEFLVTSVSTGGSGGEDRLTENVSINFRTIDLVYQTQKQDGSADAQFPFKFNFATHAEK
jgi:type VI secretion system secreted protein Hcp